MKFSIAFCIYKIYLLFLLFFSGFHNYPRVFTAFNKSIHISRSCTISLQCSTPRSSKSFYTTSIPYFRGRPIGLFPSGFPFQFSTIMVIASVFRLMTCPRHFILWLFMNPLINTIFNSSFSSWLNFLHHWPVLVSLTGQHIILHIILFSKVFNHRSDTLVVVHTKIHNSLKFRLF